MLARVVVIGFCLGTSVSAFPWWVGSGDFVETAAAGVPAKTDWGLPDVMTEHYRFGVEMAQVDFSPAVEEEPKWFVRAEYATPSKNSLGDIVSGDIELLGANESYCLTLGRYLKRDAWDLPLDISLNGTVCFHPSNASQEDILQYLLWIQFQWTEFPWNDHVRTKVGFGEGLSYVEHVTNSELVRRDYRNSLHLLNYLEFSVSLNMEDLFALTRLDRVIPGGDSEVWGDAWLVGSLHHRSGGNGIFGNFVDKDGSKKPITGGDNLFVLGLALEF